jgi:hypothetical protein
MQNHRSLLALVLCGVCSLIIAGNCASLSHLLTLSQSLPDPSPPVWPVAFQETFTEISTLPVVGTGTNIHGTYYYDFDQKAV